MAIVTGDRYLDFLVKFVERKAGTLLDGSLALKLNPVGLHYVQSRLEALRELEGLLAAAPVDYLRAYVSDLGDHRALEQLRRILGLLTSLKIFSVLPPPSRDPTPLCLQAFGRLRVLELRGCDLSTSSPRGLLQLRDTLEKLVCHNSTDALRHVFASRIADIKDSPAWSRLIFVSCAQNRLVLMDESLQLLPAVETLDLSRNQFAKVDNLGRSSKLRHLDLGFNHLRTIACLGEVSCPIVKLVLRNNALTTLRGLENLKSVEGLDLSCNLISNFSELEILANLPRLQNLWLEGNPICCARWYRASVYSFFSNPERLILDDYSISTKEYWERHFIYTSRQKQPPAFGFYFPAEEHTKEDNIAPAIKRKHPRLANIEDEDQRRYLCMEAIEQDSLSCDTDIFKKDENATPDDDLKIIGLMSKVEHMKKERSTLWLRDFKDWMDQSSEDFKLNASSELSTNPLTDASFGESSHNIFDNNILDKNDPHALRSQEAISDQGQCKDDLNFSPLIVNDEPSISSFVIDKNECSELAINPTSLTAIDDIIGSYSSSIYPGSPPHYQDDILHRRLCLEEEFLQHSAESLSAGFSDSDTSCSDDETCEFNISTNENDCTSIQKPAFESTNHAAARVNYHPGLGHEEPSLTEIKTSFCDHHAKKDTVCCEEVCSTNNHVDDDYISSQLNGSVGEVERIDCRQQFKRGFISLFESLLPCNSRWEHEEVNGYLGSCRLHKNDRNEYISAFFNTNIANSETSETCQQIVICECVYQHGSLFIESEAAFLRSCNNKIYLLPLKKTADDLDIISRVLGGYRLDEIKEIVTGLGLQTLRVWIEGDITFLFLTRTVEIFEDLFGLLQLYDSSTSSTTVKYSFDCWEQVQVDLLEKYISGSLKKGIYFYSMILLLHDKRRNSWLPRSLFVIEGYIILCSENMLQFGLAMDCLGKSPPYYTFDSICPIQNILELVIESDHDCSCLTLIARSVPCENILFNHKKGGIHRRSGDWKLKWFSEDSLLRFVSLLKGMHLGSTMNVNYAS